MVAANQKVTEVKNFNPLTDYEFGQLNPWFISATSGRRISHNSDGIKLLTQAALEAFKKDVFAGAGPRFIKGIVLANNVSKNAGGEPGSWSEKLFSNLAEFGKKNIPDDPRRIPLLALKVMIPEIHAMKPIPRNFKDFHTIAKYPTFVAESSDVISFGMPSLGDIVYVDFLDRARLQDPVYIKPVMSSGPRRVYSIPETAAQAYNSPCRGECGVLAPAGEYMMSFNSLQGYCGPLPPAIEHPCMEEKNEILTKIKKHIQVIHGRDADIPEYNGLFNVEGVLPSEISTPQYGAQKEAAYQFLVNVETITNLAKEILNTNVRQVEDQNLFRDKLTEYGTLLDKIQKDYSGVKDFKLCEVPEGEELAPYDSCVWVQRPLMYNKDIVDPTDGIMKPPQQVMQPLIDKYVENFLDDTCNSPGPATPTPESMPSERMPPPPIDPTISAEQKEEQLKEAENKIIEEKEKARTARERAKRAGPGTDPETAQQRSDDLEAAQRAEEEARKAEDAKRALEAHEPAPPPPPEERDPNCPVEKSTMPSPASQQPQNGGRPAKKIYPSDRSSEDKKYWFPRTLNEIDFNNDHFKYLEEKWGAPGGHRRSGKRSTQRGFYRNWKQASKSVAFHGAEDFRKKTLLSFAISEIYELYWRQGFTVNGVQYSGVDISLFVSSHERPGDKNNHGTGAAQDFEIRYRDADTALPNLYTFAAGQYLLRNHRIPGACGTYLNFNIPGTDKYSRGGVPGITGINLSQQGKVISPKKYIAPGSSSNTHHDYRGCGDFKLRKGAPKSSYWIYGNLDGKGNSEIAKGGQIGKLIKWLKNNHPQHDSIKQFLQSWIQLPLNYTGTQSNYAYNDVTSTDKGIDPDDFTFPEITSAVPNFNQIIGLESGWDPGGPIQEDTPVG